MSRLRDLAKTGQSALVRPPMMATAALAVSVMLAAVAVVAAIPPAEKGGARAVAAAVPGPSTFYTLPDFIADLRTTGSKGHYAQIGAVIEIPEEEAARLHENEPQIIADMQTCLRDMDRQDLAGSAGTERVRGTLLSIVDRHIAPADARSVLFTRFLVD